MGLLDLISELEEKEVVQELRMTVKDNTIESMFSNISILVEDLCTAADNDWSLDTDNLEGVRVRIGEGGFFMLRKSLHDPIISLQVEASSVDQVRDVVIDPLITLLNEENVSSTLDIDCLTNY